jgi:hypothetical protein
MNKKAEEGGTGISGKLVALILMIAVVFVAYYLIASYYSSDPLGIFPDYTLDENVVQYDGRQKLLRPGLIVYYLDPPTLRGFDDNDDDIYFTYITNSDIYQPGWYWQVITSGETESYNPLVFLFKEKRRYLGWINVDGSQKHNFGEQTNADKNTIRSLRGKSPEDGLRLLAKRVVVEQAEKGWYQSSSQLSTLIGDGKSKIEETYYGSDARLKDLDNLIIRINQRTKGYLK